MELLAGNESQESWVKKLDSGTEPQLWGLWSSAPFVWKERSTQARHIVFSRLAELNPDWLASDKFDILFRRSDQGEQVALLKLLPLLNQPELYEQTAVESLRTNSLSVFSAIAFDNSYPNDYLPEHHFNHLILKSFFMGLNGGLVVGAQERLSQQLLQMLNDYVSELSIAGRELPDGLKSYRDYVLEKLS